MSTRVDDAPGETDEVGPPAASSGRPGGARRLLRSWPLVLICLTLVVVASRALQQLGDNDIWWHLRLGNDLIHQRSLAAPRWSPLATQKWTPTEPLLEIVAAWLQGIFGYAAVKWLFGVGLLGLTLAVYFATRRVADRGVTSLTCIVVLLGCSLSLSPRPQLASFALVAVVLGAWLDTERDGRARWWLVPLTWLWSLVHGLWIFGVGYGALFVVAAALSRRTPPKALLRLSLVPALSFAVVALNPAGLGVIEAPFTIPGYGKYVAEWGHTEPVGSLAALVLESMILVTVGLWCLNRRRIPVSRVLLLLTGIVWTFYAYRTVAVAAVVMGVLLAEAVQGAVASIRNSAEPVAPVRRQERRVLLTCALATLALLAVVVPHSSMQPKYVPTTLDPVLDRLPAGTVVFNTYGIGGWVTWAHPDLHPVIDGLATPYSTQYFADFHAALDGKPGWRRFVRSTGATATYMADVFRLPALLRRDGWVPMARSEGYVVLVRPKLARELGLPSAKG